MKKIITPLFAAFLLSILFISIKSNAQQSKATIYTYKVFQAPNKNFGYDIFQNDKIVYHEFASMYQPENISRPKNPGSSKLNNTVTAYITHENPALVRAEHAQKAALLAIEKMKRKESPMLSQDEIKRIIAQ